MAKELRARERLEAIKRELRELEMDLGRETRSLVVQSKATGRSAIPIELPHPHGPSDRGFENLTLSRNSDPESWQYPVAKGLSCVDFYRALTEHETHSDITIDMWATRYLWTSSFIRYRDIRDRSVFPSRWKFLADLMEQAHVTATNDEVRIAVRRMVRGQ